MNTKRSEIGLKLEPEMLNVLSLRVTLERHGNGEGCQEVVSAVCHHYEVATTDGTALDLFRVIDGRLTRVVTYNGVLSVEEVDE